MKAMSFGRMVWPLRFMDQTMPAACASSPSWPCSAACAAPGRQSLSSKLTSTCYPSWQRRDRMKSSVRPELPTVTDCSAPVSICPEFTYKSGTIVQTNRATSAVLRRLAESAETGGLSSTVWYPKNTGNLTLNFLHTRRN